MKKNKIKTYIGKNDREGRFSKDKLKAEIYKYATKNKYNISQVYAEMADKIVISEPAIRHWTGGHNAPSDIESIAEFFGIEVDDLLTFESDKENTNMNNMETIINSAEKSTVGTTDERAIISDLYASMSSMIEVFRLTDYNLKKFVVNMDSGIISEEVATKNFASFEETKNDLKKTFVLLHTNLMLHRFDVKRKTYLELCSFTVNYLQQLCSYIDYEIFLTKAYAENDIISVEECNPYYNEYHKYLHLSDEERTKEFSGFGEELALTINDSEFEEPFIGVYEHLESFYVKLDKDSIDSRVFSKSLNKIEIHIEEMIMEISRLNLPETTITENAYNRLDEILKDYIIE